MLSVRLILPVLAATALTAAPASAADPLLSGYSGPGGVEQTLLGGDTGGGTGTGGGGNSGGGGDGGNSGGGGGQPAAERPLGVPAGTVQTTVTPAGTAVQSAGAGSTASGGSGKADKSGSAEGATPTGGPSAAATAVRYPERTAEAGGSGLPEGAVPAVVLGLLLVLALGLSMRRLAAPRIA